MKLNFDEPIFTAKQLTDFALDDKELKLVSNRGFVVTPQKILRCYRLTDFEKILLIDLLSLMGERGYAFPSHGTLAFRQGKKSTASIKSTLNSLCKKGFINWKAGGADLGTNHYKVQNLSYNPYIIMSEFTHYYVNVLIQNYRGIIQYDVMYSTVLDIVEKPKSLIGTEEDAYGKFISYLFKNPHARDDYQLYYLLKDIFNYHVELATDREINIDWNKHLTDHFGSEIFNDLSLHPIEKVIENPYDKLPIIVEMEESSWEKEDEEFLELWYQEAQAFYQAKSMEELWKESEEIILDDPYAYFGIETESYKEFKKLKESNGDYISLVRKVIRDDPKGFLVGLKMLEAERHLQKF
ncbi:helix-turn-helix domain-containing protein [Domibacillus tundrae]|uniref:helix-turn-helix domain-containing protein n=1 Tax=Domibacillus tundrae TaxID=1587527 RepID=UPI0006181CDE|nr:helix-turn-helix domain-containing protein [Domibacillus tundrae]